MLRFAPMLKSMMFWFSHAFLTSLSLPPHASSSPSPSTPAASVELPWQRAVSQNKVPYYIK
jgi:hypothetical protein